MGFALKLCVGYNNNKNLTPMIDCYKFSQLFFLLISPHLSANFLLTHIEININPRANKLAKMLFIFL